MDGSPYPPPTLVDLVTAATGWRSSRRKPRLRGKPEQPPGMFPLVEADRLFMHVEPDDGIDSQAVEAFRAAFSATWSSVPAPARRAMCQYWRARLDPIDFINYPLLASFRPLILLRHLPDPSEPRCEVAGRVLLFPASAAGAQRRHAADVGEMLAAVYRIATRLHWRRVMTMLEDPITEWERRQAGPIDEDARDRVLDRLERVYLRQYRSDIAAILRDWGLTPSPCPRQRRRRAKRGSVER